MANSHLPSSNGEQPRVALVADWIVHMGGGEKVIEAFHKLYPEAPIYASYCAERWRPWLGDKVITGYLQRWPFSTLRRFLPVLRQHWYKHLDLSDFDLVISITGNGEAKFVRPSHIPIVKRLSRFLRLSPVPNIQSPTPVHVSYCHTPTHFYWAHYDEYIAHPSIRPRWLARLALKSLVKPLRNNDFKAAQKVDHFIANSTSIQADIKKYYKRDSTVIHPPISIDHFVHLSPRGETRTVPEKPCCITWGRAVPFKRIDIAIEACNELGWPLVVMGSGPDIARLKKIAGPTIDFPGYVTDQDREKYIKNSDLFLFCAHEDFGVAPVEALAAGLPLVAFQAGGALDYVIDGNNGAFFAEQTTESLVSALRKLPGKQFELATFSASVKEFANHEFDKKIRAFVEKYGKGDES